MMLDRDLGLDVGEQLDEETDVGEGRRRRR
jgi:hypothetical protein